MIEKKISLDKVPNKVYHIVPLNLFEEYIDSKGVYDPRNKENFGNNAPFIHTTPSIEQMNKHLPYLKQIPDKKFNLLEIDIKKLNPKKITYIDFEGQRYHHLWCSLNPESYRKKIVKKNNKGNIIL